MVNYLLYAMLSFQSIHRAELERYRDYVPDFRPHSVRVLPLAGVHKDLGKIVYGRYPYWRGTRYTALRFDLLTDISWFAIELNGRGDVENWHGWPSQWTDLINMAHSNGVRVHVSVACMDADQIDSIILSPENTARAISNILQAVESAGIEGVTIDFEFPRSTSRDAFTSFMTALYDTLKGSNPNYMLTYDYFAEDDYWGDHYDQDSLEEVSDWVYVMAYDYHWGGSEETGPVSPLIGWGGLNVTWTIEHLAMTTDHPEKYLLGVPYYAYRWPAANIYPHAPTTGQGSSIFYSTAIDEATAFGLRWDHEGETVWYRYSNYQVWFDDSLSLSFKYSAALRAGWAGIGIWALSYDEGRSELWNLINRYFNHEVTGVPPSRPVGFYVRNVGDGSLEFIWKPVDGADGYRIYRTDGNSFDLMADVADTAWISPVMPDTVLIFVMTAYNQWGESDFTEMLAVRAADSTASILLVDGVERQTGTWNTRNFTIEHASSIYSGGAVCDAASNDMVRLGVAHLEDYDMVDWVLGEEGTRDTTFAPDEQDSVASYLQQGGKMFVSGAEIGYDLVGHGTTGDQQFFANYLVARYIGDDANTHDVTGVPGEMFDGLSFQFDDGTHGHYDVDYPDILDGYGGSRVVLLYQGGNGGGAGIAYTGVFPGGTTPGGMVFFGFPFETIYDEQLRNSVMRRILRFYGLESIEETGENRSNAVVNVRTGGDRVVFLMNGGAGDAMVEIFDVSGRLLHRTKLTNGRAEWHGCGRSGVFLYRVVGADRRKLADGKIVILR